VEEGWRSRRRRRTRRRRRRMTRKRIRRRRSGRRWRNRWRRRWRRSWWRRAVDASTSSFLSNLFFSHVIRQIAPKSTITWA